MTDIELTEKVKKTISDYIEFDIEEIFEQGDYISIYGGAVRDSLADMDIHDVDILCMPKSAINLLNFLQEKYDYEFLDLYDQDKLNMYEGLSIINQPWTLMNNNKKIIQIIRPSKGYNDSFYYNLLKNVDISCCGIFLDKNDNKILLRESCKNGIINCLSKTFTLNKWSELYTSNRTPRREHKLISRGWLNLDNPWDKKTLIQKERSMKILKLEFNPKYDYKIWTEEEYLLRERSKYDDDDLPF